MESFIATPGDQHDSVGESKPNLVGTHPAPASNSGHDADYQGR
jgi:hypothetical protein